MPPVNTRTSRIIITPVVRKTGTATPKDTPFLSPPTLTTTPTIEPVDGIINTKCLAITPTLPDTVVPAYSLVFSSWGDDPKYIYSFKTKQRSVFSKEIYPYTTSYDGNWFTYNEEQFGVSEWMVMETYDKKVKRKYKVQSSWDFAYSWLDANRLLINLNQDPVPSVLVINPRTNEQTVLSSKYPNLLPFDGIGHSRLHFGVSSVVYDPSLELVVYLKTLEDGDRFRSFITLFDRRTKTELANLEDEPSSRFLNHPVWSLDGQEVIIANNLNDVKEIYSIQRDGLVSQLTHFRSIYQDLEIDGISLSPDKRYLAFWLILSESPIDEKLILLNMETKEIIDLCIPSAEKYAGNPIWSPDSRYFAVAISNKANTDQTILVDSQGGWAAQVSDQLPTGERSYPVGWLKEP